MKNRQAVVACARRFAGVRFAHQGRSSAGLDCLGLLLATATAAELHFDLQPINMLDVPNYGMRPDTQFLQQKLKQFLSPVTQEALLPADILLLNIGGAPQHLAIVSDYPCSGELGMIHAYAPARKVVEHRYDAAWQQATHAFYRLPHFN